MALQVINPIGSPSTFGTITALSVSIDGAAGLQSGDLVLLCVTQEQQSAGQTAVSAPSVSGVYQTANPEIWDVLSTDSGANILRYTTGDWDCYGYARGGAASGAPSNCLVSAVFGRFMEPDDILSTATGTPAIEVILTVAQNNWKHARLVIIRGADRNASSVTIMKNIGQSSFTQTTDTGLGNDEVFFLQPTDTGGTGYTEANVGNEFLVMHHGAWRWDQIGITDTAVSAGGTTSGWTLNRPDIVRPFSGTFGEPTAFGWAGVTNTAQGNLECGYTKAGVFRGSGVTQDGVHGRVTYMRIRDSFSDLDSDWTTTTTAFAWDLDDGPWGKACLSLIVLPAPLTTANAIELGDTASGSDSLSVAIAAPTTDTATTADTAELVKQIPFDESDEASAADSVTLDVGVAIADTASSSGSVAVGRVELIGDTATAEDPAPVLTHVDLTTHYETLGDAATAVDSIPAPRIVHGEVLSPSDSADTANASDDADIQTPGTYKTIFEDASSSDSVDLSVAVSVTATDTATTEDDLTPGRVLLLSDTASTASAAFLTHIDSPNHLDEDEFSTASDSVALGFAVVLSDTVTVADATSQTAYSVETDTASTADSVDLLVTIGLGFSDKTTATDDANIRPGIQDYSTTFDSVLISIGLSADLSDAASTADAVSTSQKFYFSDTAGAGDAAEIRGFNSEHAIDEASTSDSLTVDIGLSLASTASTADSATVDIAISFSDSASTADNANIPKTVLDISIASDSISRTATHTITLSDGVNSSDIGYPDHTDEAGRVQVSIAVTIDGVGDIAENFLKRSERVSVESVWNTGLTQLGVNTVGSQSDTSAQAVLLRNIWNNFRKQFIADHAWNGCKTTAVLTALPSSDFKDSTRWNYVFSLPTDYIRALTLNGHPNQPDNSARTMWEVEIVADTSGEKSRCVVTNQGTAKLEYVFDVGDAGMDLLSPAMKHAMGLSLAAFVAPNFGKSANEIALIEGKAREAVLKARGVDGQESSGKFFSSTELLDARYGWN